MAKLTRYTQKVFGSSATTGQLKQFGSLAAGAPANAVTPADVQALSNYLTGWFGAVIGTNSPAIEDMNSLCYLYGYQLAYLMQQGVPEWDASTTYYVGSMAQDGAGKIYQSLQNTNLNNALTVTAFWQQIFPLNLAGGAISVTGLLPLASVGLQSPTTQKFTVVGSGTYTRPTPAPLYVRVRLVGGGGGAGGAGANGAATAGIIGGLTSFGTQLVGSPGGPGLGSGGSNYGGPGGAATLGTITSGFIVVGGYGCGGYLGSAGGLGGSTPFGPTSPYNSPAQGGAGALANTGCGGAGSSVPANSTTTYGGHGGGGGGYVEAILSGANLTSTMSYVVGVGGAGGAGFAGGGNAGSGFIIVDEFYS